MSTDFQHSGNVRYIEEWATEDALRQRTHALSFTPLARLIRDVSRSPRIACTRGDDDLIGLAREMKEAVRIGQDVQTIEEHADALLHHHAHMAGPRAITTH